MANYIYSENDLTVVVPTLGRDLGLLVNILQTLRQESDLVSLVIVWDSDTAPDNSFKKNLESGYRLEFICHSHNKGLSAARNTGISNIKTSLGMFLDDDVIPGPGSISEIISFHNNNTGIMIMQLGKVTWKGGDYQSCLTDWFETYGNWNVHNLSVDKAEMSIFLGTFTSFKTAAFDELQFDEGFRRYGCEDIEFGYRFFAAGGCLVFCENIMGIHYNDLTLSAYLKNHLASGYSKALMWELHPDCFEFAYLLDACHKLYTDEQMQSLIQLCQAALDTGELSDELNFFMTSVTNQAMYKGFIEFYADRNPLFSKFLEEMLRTQDVSSIDLNELGELLPTLAPLKVSAALLCDNNLEKAEQLKKTVSFSAYYAQPYLELIKLDREKWQTKLEKFYNENFQRLDNTTRSRVLEALGDKTSAQKDDSPRSMYFEVVDNLENWSNEKIIAHCSEVLQKDPSFVSAYLILIEKLIHKDNSMALILLAQARYFLKYRPLSQQSEDSIQLNQFEEILKDEAL